MGHAEIPGMSHESNDHKVMPEREALILLLAKKGHPKEKLREKVHELIAKKELRTAKMCRKGKLTKLLALLATVA